jgi:hypothetical protein
LEGIHRALVFSLTVAEAVHKGIERQTEEKADSELNRRPGVEMTVKVWTTSKMPP